MEKITTNTELIADIAWTLTVAANTNQLNVDGEYLWSCPKPYNFTDLRGRSKSIFSSGNAIKDQFVIDYMRSININHCLQNFDFDYIYRTNLSSVLNLNKLYSYLQNNTVDYAGQHMETFISGSGIILSKEACKKLIQDKSLIDNMEPDDVAIGKTLSKIYEMINIEFYALSSIDDKIFTDNNYNNVNPITFQFRCRFSNEHTQTPQAMEKMYQKIYS